MSILINTYVALFGVVLGSFFNVVGYRILNNRSILFPRSHCPHCLQVIRSYDLIPIISYLLLKGKCRKCHHRISLIYPIVEASTGILFLSTFLHATTLEDLIAQWLLIALIMITLVTDLNKMIIPNQLILSFFIIFVLFRMVFPLNPWWDSILASTLICMLLTIFALISKGGIGGGDIKLLTIVGILLGTKQLMIGLFLAFLFGALICGTARILKLLKKDQPIPFVPFIAIGLISALFFGDLLFIYYWKAMLGFSDYYLSN
ncbi:prepilin peptidase [Sporolactobacillus laevolacticus]|uniref:prepilin peptidase n=1 Tax=Sporolactobacillus laevolacticus TaxID=33018 RepID=UPI0025B45C52|nr:A24 family peptidase [Sporolactobacillus laevolacticus]MDN3955479.1 prepilin peptidase [Sporolactobacillus laevolacticus]